MRTLHNLSMRTLHNRSMHVHHTEREGERERKVLAHIHTHTHGHTHSLCNVCTCKQTRTSHTHIPSGYKQTQGDLQYDNASRRMFANEIERMLGIVADKILSHGTLFSPQYVFKGKNNRIF